MCGLNITWQQKQQQCEGIYVLGSSLASNTALIMVAHLQKKRLKGKGIHVSLEAKGSNCVCKWLVVQSLCLSTDEMSNNIGFEVTVILAHYQQEVTGLGLVEYKPLTRVSPSCDSFSFIQFIFILKLNIFHMIYVHNHDQCYRASFLFLSCFSLPPHLPRCDSPPTFPR